MGRQTFNRLCSLEGPPSVASREITTPTDSQEFMVPHNHGLCDKNLQKSLGYTTMVVEDRFSRGVRFLPFSSTSLQVAEKLGVSVRLNDRYRSWTGSSRLTAMGNNMTRQSTWDGQSTPRTHYLTLPLA